MKKIKMLLTLLMSSEFFPLVFAIGKGKFQFNILEINNSVDDEGELQGAFFGIEGSKKGIILNVLFIRISIRIKVQTSLKFTTDAKKSNDRRRRVEK